MFYFNYRVHFTTASEASYWQRRAFLHAWWSIYGKDRRWTPPNYHRLARELQPLHNPHLARMQPTLVFVDALQHTGMQTARQDQPVPLSNILERPLAAAVILQDPRREDKTGYLALLQIANDPEALERLLDAVFDWVRVRGMRRMLVPTGLSPYVGTGIQSDGWNLGPPFGAPSNPPYVPDLLKDVAQPAQSGVLYQAVVPGQGPAGAGPPVTGPATLQPLDPQQLVTDLLPIWAESIGPTVLNFAPPDTLEAAFILRWLGPAAHSGWLAERDGRPVGFVLLGPDSAEGLRLAGGGKHPYQRALLAARNRLGSPAAGRLFFGGVIPDQRRQGIGRQLWDAALQIARTNGWQRLSIGPVWTEAGLAFLAAQGASPIQTAEILDLAR